MAKIWIGDLELLINELTELKNKITKENDGKYETTIPMKSATRKVHYLNLALGGKDDKVQKPERSKT